MTNSLEKFLTRRDFNAKLSKKESIHRGPEAEEVRRASQDMVSNTEANQLIKSVNGRR